MNTDNVRAAADKPGPTTGAKPPKPVNGPLEAHTAVLEEARALYEQRADERAEVWRRSGLRGQTFHCMAKAERAFLQVMAGELPNRDHFIDLINYAAFACRLLTEAEHEAFQRNVELEDLSGDQVAAVLNGEWPWG